MLLEQRCNTITNELKAIYEKEVYYFESNKPLFELWYHQESNRGHKDFQSFALPTELWHLYFLICVCKGSFFSVNTQIFQSKNIIVADFCVTLHVQIARLRDLAQLVAHYVRDVGVGRSSRLIPTLLAERKAERLSLFCFIMT